MTPDPAPTRSAPSATARPVCAVRFDTDAACARCGVLGAFDFDEEKLCAGCYAERGACCAESAGEKPEPLA